MAHHLKVTAETPRRGEPKAEELAQINKYVCTSVDDLRSALPHAQDVEVLKAALCHCQAKGYKSKATLLERRIKQLEKEENELKPFPFLVNEERKHVIEQLQLWGDFPECDEENACEADWTHLLAVNFTDVMEQCRLDRSEIEVLQKLRRKLAAIVATVTAWDQQIIKESR